MIFWVSRSGLSEELRGTKEVSVGCQVEASIVEHGRPWRPRACIHLVRVRHEIDMPFHYVASSPLELGCGHRRKARRTGEGDQ